MLKKIFIIFLFIFLFGGIVYANDTDLVKLKKDIDNAPYVAADYKEDIFDCSNMSNLLDDWLEQKGYDTKIILLPSHAMVLVNYEILIEATDKFIVNGMFPENCPKINEDIILITPDAEYIVSYYENISDWKKEWSYPHKW